MSFEEDSEKSFTFFTFLGRNMLMSRISISLKNFIISSGCGKWLNRGTSNVPNAKLLLCIEQVKYDTFLHGFSLRNFTFSARYLSEKISYLYRAGNDLNEFSHCYTVDL